MDKRNHGVNALEFIAMDIPTDLVVFKNQIYSSDGTVIGEHGEAAMRKVYNPYAETAFTKTRRQRTSIRDLGDDSIW